METNWIWLIVFVAGFFALLVVLQMLSNRIAENNKQTPPGQESVGQTAAQTGANVTKDVVKSTLVWTLSGMLVNFFKGLIQPKKK